MGTCSSKSKQSAETREFWNKQKSDLGYYKTTEVKDEELKESIKQISCHVNPHISPVIIHDNLHNKKD